MVCGYCIQQLPEMGNFRHISWHTLYIVLCEIDRFVVLCDVFKPKESKRVLEN